MVSTIAILARLVAVLGISLLVTQCISLKRNINAAKEIGLPYIIAPVAFLETHWLLCEPFLLPLLKRLPKRWTSSWLPLASLLEIWRAAYLPFCQAGADVFVIVTPNGLNLWSCDAHVNDQILSSKSQGRFPKTVELLGVMRSWGPALPASEGEEARLTRKAAMPCFSEQTHRRVWEYGIERTGAMMQGEWSISRSEGGQTGMISDVVKDCKAWTLSVICAVCYGKKLELDGNKNVPPGFKLGFADAVTKAFQYFFTIFLVPKTLLRYLPIKNFNEAYLAYTAWYKHLNKMREDEKLRQLHGVDQLSSSNILGNLVANEVDPEKPGVGYLPKDVVLGNISNFVVAGHETTANTLGFIVVVMALNPDVQQKVHEELMDIFGVERISQPEKWSFERDFPLLLNGLVGAVQNETMRLFPLAPTSTRKTMSPQELRVNGHLHSIPGGCKCFPNTVATHTNPKYWGALVPVATQKGIKIENENSCASDGFIMSQKLDKWYPFRWLDSNDDGEVAGPFVVKTNSQAVDEKGAEFGQTKSVMPGTFLPFSRGARSCIGTRFAQVELCAFMARLFAECEVKVDTVSPGNEEEARRLVMRQITIDAETTVTYKPADKIKLLIVRREH